MRNKILIGAGILLTVFIVFLIIICGASGGDKTVTQDELTQTIESVVCDVQDENSINYDISLLTNDTEFDNEILEKTYSKININQHVPELELFDNLFEISQLGDKCFFKIKCSDHPTCLPNGEPTNCTVHDKQWWKNFLYKYYSSIEEIFCSDSSSVIFLAKN